jgi:hypothetical protein
MSRPPKCKACGMEFIRVKTTQTACSLECAIKLAGKAREKAAALVAKVDRDNTRAAKEKAKPRAKWMGEAQVAFNRYIRARDAGLPCVSCGTTNPRQWHAGHYRTTKAAPELRFHPDNCNKQCSQCNNKLSANLLLYRPELIRRIGLAQVEFLEGPHEPARYTIPELREIKEGFTAWARELEKEEGFA